MSGDKRTTRGQKSAVVPAMLSLELGDFDSFYLYFIMTSINRLEDGEIDSSEDIKNVRKTSSYKNEPGSEVGGADIKPNLHGIQEISNGRRSSRKKKLRSPSSSSLSSGSDSRSCSSSSSGSHSGSSTSSSTGTGSSSRSSVSSDPRSRKRKHAEVANGKKKKRRDLSSSSSSSSSTSRSRKPAKKSAKPSAQKKELVGEHVPDFLIRELAIEKGNMRALTNAFQFQLDRIKGLLIGKVVSGYYAKSPINYKVFDVTNQAANKLPAYIRGGRSVAQHFSMKQGIALRHPYWPCLIQDGGGGHKNYYPVEMMYVQ